MKTTTYYHAASGQYASVGSSFIIGNVLHGNNWLERASDAEIAAKGLVPVVTIETVPEDYHNYNRTEELIGAERIVTWTRKSDEQIAQMLQAETNAKSLAYLAETDWMVTRFAETGVVIPDDVKAARQAARDSIHHDLQVPHTPA